MIHVKKSWRVIWNEQRNAYLFLLPAIILFTIFAWFPIVRSVILSFQDVKLVGGSEWIGLDNYDRMIKDPVFESAWRNSFEFAGLSVVMGFFVPVLVAILVNEMRLAKGFFRLVYFLPTVIPGVIALLVWEQIYRIEGGYLNYLMIEMDYDIQFWLQDTSLVKPSMLVIMTWGGFGATALLYLAALQDLPVELYEASEIDGASIFNRIRHITLPHLRPTMLILLILQIIGVVQIFLEPFVLTEGGPGQATTTPVLTIYRKAFDNFQFGLASAWSVLLIIVLAVFSFIYLRVSRVLDDPDRLVTLEPRLKRSHVAMFTISGVVVLWSANFLGIDAAAAMVVIIGLILMTLEQLPERIRQVIYGIMFLATILLINEVLATDVALVSFGMGVCLYLSTQPFDERMTLGLHMAVVGLIYLGFILLVGTLLGLALGSLISLIYVLSLELPTRYAMIFYAIINLEILALIVELVGIESTHILILGGGFLLLYRPNLTNWPGLALFGVVCVGAIALGLTWFADFIGNQAAGGIVGLLIGVILLQPGARQQQLPFQVPGLYLNILYPIDAFNYSLARLRNRPATRPQLLAPNQPSGVYIHVFYLAALALIMLASLTIMAEEIGNRAFSGALGLLICVVLLQLVPTRGGEAWERGVISKLEMMGWNGQLVYRVIMIGLLMLAVTVIFPFIFTFTAGLKTPRGIYRSGLTLWPDVPLWETYTNAWERFDIVQLMQNTFVIVLGSLIMQIGVSILAAYSLSRLKPVAGRYLMMGFLVTLMIPSIAYLVPLYVTVSDLDLVGSYWGIWLPAGVNAFMIFVLKSFFDNLPSELFDAAKVDGAGPLQILRRIVLPLSRPIILVFSILTFVNFWKDFLWPYLILLLHPDKQPIAVFLYRITETTDNVPLNQQMAAYFMAMIPPLVIAIFLQRYMRQGLSVGAVKG